MKILFLDIDGCLNSNRSEQAYGKQKTIENLDPIAVTLIHEVVSSTGCIICLSSDWRLYWDYMELGKKLSLPILFETNHSQEGLRVAQVQEVLDGVKPSSYCILDDEEVDGEFDGMNFVEVDGNNGVSYKNYLDMVDILK